MAITTKPYDPARFLKTDEARAAYLTLAFEDGDLPRILKALDTVARAAGMSALAEKAGVSRGSLYKAIGVDGNPEFATVAKLLDAMELGFTITPKAEIRARAEARELESV